MSRIEMTPTGDWRGLCRVQGIDPAEVELVSGRYVAYRDYMATRGDGLPLEAWFRFYCMEKESEVGVAGAAVSGCSATGEPMAQALLTRPGVFLEVLKARLGVGN